MRQKPSARSLGAVLVLALMVLTLPSCSAILNSDPNLRWWVFSHFGAGKICPEMIKTSVPIRLQDPNAPSTGRFFPMTCTCTVNDASRTIVVSVSGTGYGFVSPAKRVGFSLSATAEYRPDFVIAGKDLYLWARMSRIVDGPRFQTAYIENPIVEVVSNVGNLSNSLGNNVVSGVMAKGFTVIRNDDNPDNPDFALGIYNPPQKPFHPFQAAINNRFTFANEITDIEANQRDYLGPFEITGSNKAFFFTAQVSGPPIDVIIVNKQTGDMWRDSYQTGKPLGPPPGPVFAQNPVMPGFSDARRYNLPAGQYYVVIDNTTVAGVVGPTGTSILGPLGLGAGAGRARVSYIAQLGE